MKKLVLLLTTLVVVVGVCAAWGFLTAPTYSLLKMRAAIEEHDAAAFEQYVDIEGILRRSGNQIASEWTADITKRISAEVGLEADMVNGITSAFGSSLIEGTVKQMREAILSFIETGKPINIQALPADVIEMATDIKVANLPEVARTGKIAKITVPLLVNDEPVPVRLYMRDKGMYWQVAEIEQVGKTAQEILSAYVRGERKRFEAERTAHPDETVPLPGLVEGAKPLVMCYIPAGKFMMGRPPGEDGRDEDEGPRHNVKITQGFWIGKHEVTVEQFAAFVKATGYRTNAEKAGKSYGRKQDGSFDLIAGLDWSNPGFFQDKNSPVVHVSHEDATAYCEWISKATGDTWRLPSEAEWEYACRAGTSTTYFWGQIPGAGEGYVNAADWTAQRLVFYHWDRKELFPFEDGYAYTSPVGTYTPNAWGLHDMTGNVSEWCQDWSVGGYYAVSPANDPEGPATGSFRIVRGGSWFSIPEGCRSAYRVGMTPGASTGGIGGFRLAR